MKEKQASKKERPFINLTDEWGFEILDTAFNDFFETGAKEDLVLILPHVQRLDGDQMSVVLNAAADYLHGIPPSARKVKSIRNQIDLYERVETISRGGLLSEYQKEMTGQSIQKIIEKLCDDNRLKIYKNYESATKAYYQGKKLCGGEPRPPGRKPKKS